MTKHYLGNNLNGERVYIEFWGGRDIVLITKDKDDNEVTNLVELSGGAFDGLLKVLSTELTPEGLNIVLRGKEEQS